MPQHLLVVHQAFGSPVERLPPDLVASKFHEFKHLVMGYKFGAQDLPKQRQVLCAAQFETPLLVPHDPY